MEDYRQQLPQLSDFSKADQLPCVVRVEESSTALPQLRRGTRLVLLSVQSGDIMLIGEEGTGIKYREISVNNVTTRFSVLPHNSRNDNKLFHSVEDIVGLQGSDRPEYVRAVQGWEPLIDEGDIFRVRSAVQRAQGRGFCAKWDRMQMGAGGPASVDLATCRCNEVLIDMDITIPFSTSLEPCTYTLSEIAEKHRNGEMLMPLRLQIEEEVGDPASELNQRRRKPGKYVLDGVYKTTVLLAMKTFVPGGVVAGRPFLRIPSTVAQAVMVSPVQQSSECRADMAHVMDVLLRDRDFSSAELVLDASSAAPFLAPPMQLSSAGGAGGGDDDDDDADSYDDYSTYTEPYQHLPSMRAPRVGADGRQMDIPNVPSASATMPPGSQAMSRRTTPSECQQRASTLAPAPSHLPRDDPTGVSSLKQSLYTQSASLDTGKQLLSKTDSRANDYSSPATIQELSRRRLSNPGNGDVSHACDAEDDSHYRRSRTGSSNGTLSIPTRKRTPSPTPRRDASSTSRASPLTATMPLPKPTRPVDGDGMYVDLVASVEMRNKQHQQAPPIAKQRTPLPPPPQPTAPQLTTDVPRYNTPVIRPFDSTIGSGGFPLPPPPLRSLNAVELIDKLRQADLGQYIRVFRSQGIDGETFCELDDQDLQHRIGVVGRKELEAFRNLRMQ